MTGARDASRPTLAILNMDFFPDDLLITIWRKLGIRDCANFARTCRRFSRCWAGDCRLICTERTDSEFGFIKSETDRPLIFGIADPLSADACERYAKLCRARAVLPPGLTLIPPPGGDPALFTFDGLLTLRQARIAATRGDSAWVEFIRDKDRLAFAARAAAAFSTKYEQCDVASRVDTFGPASEDVYAVCLCLLQTDDWQGFYFLPVLEHDVRLIPESSVL
jgi:hypothetical protein